MNTILFAFLLVVASVAAAYTPDYISAWIRADGEVVSLVGTGDVMCNVTKVEDGHYCLNFGPDFSGTYLPIQATVQSTDVGIAVANSGWGDLCNEYAVNSVRTYDMQGKKTDMAFSVHVSSTH